MNFKHMYLQKYIYSLIHCKYTKYSSINHQHNTIFLTLHLTIFYIYLILYY